MSNQTLNPANPQYSVQLTWGVRIPLRDGISLNATLYVPQNQAKRMPSLFTLTPYIGQLYHDTGVYFASHGYPFLTVDTRGRGNSEGVFKPFYHEARDGFDVVEWLANQPYCDGSVAMWGGSYAGFDQWTVAAQRPSHLKTIIPVASPYLAGDFPLRNNVAYPYMMQWLTLVSGHASQTRIFEDQGYWNQQFTRWFVSGKRFRDLDTLCGNASPHFQEWLDHPLQGAYWEQYNPTTNQYREISIPVLTVTGMYDADQVGALTHYREHIAHSHDKGAQHYLVIGPWDHAGTRTPKLEFGGLRFGTDSLLDLGKLHLQWYSWVMEQGPKPDFLQKRVAYYVTGSEAWRYVDSLEEATAETRTLYLGSICNPSDVFQSGTLTPNIGKNSDSDEFVYDPRDTSNADLERRIDPESLVDQRMIHALIGKQLIYHSPVFEKDTEVTGFFRVVLWLAIDAPDTDFMVTVFEIDQTGGSILLANDWIRARYRQGLKQPVLIQTTEPLQYEFSRFPFVSRMIRTGHRLRLVVGPSNSIFMEKNFNAGGVVGDESVKDARTVTVMLHHDDRYQSALHMPIGR